MVARLDAEISVHVRLFLEYLMTAVNMHHNEKRACISHPSVVACKQYSRSATKSFRHVFGL